MNLRFICVFTSFLIRMTSTSDSYANEIRRPPFIENGPSLLTIFNRGETSSTILECVASGWPAPTYRWYRNNNPADSDANKDVKMTRLNTFDGTVNVSCKGLAESCGGYYQCLAGNGYGVAASDIAVVVGGFFRIPAARNSSFVPIDEGKFVKLECASAQSIPNAIYYWEKHGDKTFAYSERISHDEHGTLYFANVLPEDDGLYACCGKNTYIHQISNSICTTDVRINVTRRSNASHSPIFVYQSPSQVIGLRGKDVSLRCIFAGMPTPKVIWTTTTGSTLEIANGTELLIRNLSTEDAGLYSCSSTNNVGDETYTINLIIEAVPTLTQKLQNINVTEGRTVVMICNATAIPDANIQWYINAVPFQVTPRRQLSHNKKTLIFASVCKYCPDDSTDLVVVSCNVSNKHGYDYTSGYLNVLDATEITEEPKNVELEINSTDDLTMKCGPKFDPSTPGYITWSVDNEALHADADMISIDYVEGELRIAQGRWKDYDNKYFVCNASTDYSHKSARALFTILLPTSAGAVGVVATAGYWWLYAVAAVILVLLIVLFVYCYLWFRRNRNEKYEVDKLERQHGLDPERELLNSGFKHYLPS